MRLFATLLLAVVFASSVGCSWGRGCGCGSGGSYGSYYGGSSCPGGNCGVQQGAFNQGYNGLQSASIPGAYPVTASAQPVYYGQPVVTASAPIAVPQTASAPIPTYGN